MSKIENVCVYCGASSAVDAVYIDAARSTGTELAKSGMTVVYGGGASGLMGMTADAALAAHGKVTGIFPKFLEKFEDPHKKLTTIHIVKNMHDRKQMMAELADCFVILPGGFGTLDEFFEILTWRQLELHDKPVFLVNINGYWDMLLKAIEHIFESKFAREKHRRCFVTVNSIAELMEKIKHTDSHKGFDKTRI